MSDAALVFLDNLPFNEAACSGAFYIDVSSRESRESAKTFIKQWWDLSNEVRNFGHPFEQDSLHRLLSKGSESACVSFEHQFPHALSDAEISETQRQSQFVIHIPSRWKQLRKGEFFRGLSTLRVGSTSFSSLIQEITSTSNSKGAHAIPIAESMKLYI